MAKGQYFGQGGPVLRRPSQPINPQDATRVQMPPIPQPVAPKPGTEEYSASVRDTTGMTPQTKEEWRTYDADQQKRKDVMSSKFPRLTYGDSTVNAVHRAEKNRENLEHTLMRAKGQNDRGIVPTDDE